MAALSTKLTFADLLTKWAAQLNPILANPVMQGRALNAVVLVANTPQTLNHGLSQTMRGWFVTDQGAAANVYRTQPLNAQTITLEASANVTINLWVF
jgi:hypothetical protein